MKTVVVASTNPVKIRAARAGFERMFPGEHFRVTGVAAPSGVSDQPASDGETYQGARNRAAAAEQLNADADFWVGIEGGVELISGQLQGFAWVVVRGAGRIGSSRTATFALPDAVAQLVRAGTELGLADDIVFGRTNSKQENGSVGLLTHDVIDRAAYYEHAVILALIPFRNAALTFDGG
ncbi:MAG: non-canonical purine NTP phosphatase [Chloroflexota bacterium]|nr:MAG: non-canonical purine NTP phosphatase [Chloroflexota bacterium]